MEELTKIVDIQLRRLETQLAEAGLTLRITDEAKARLAEEGFDPAYGARPLKRVIQQRLANPLATALLEERIAEGDTVEIGWDAQQQEFLFDARPRRGRHGVKPLSPKSGEPTPGPDRRMAGASWTEFDRRTTVRGPRGRRPRSAGPLAQSLFPEGQCRIRRVGETHRWEAPPVGSTHP